MYTRKQLPKTQYELSKGSEDKELQRANEVRRDDDTIKDLSIGLYDIDYAIKYYFEQIIKPEVVEFGTKVKVPVLYGSPEKWKNVQADGYFRDKNGKIQSPLITYKRTSIAKNRGLSNKVDANHPNIYYTQEVKYSQVNKYDQFSKLTNSKPIKTFINTVIPDYVDVTYDVIIWTDYVESMNKIVESVLYTEGSYWGEPEKFKFRTKIDNFTNTTDLMQDADRIVRTSFQLTIFGHIVPDAVVKELSDKLSNKTFDTRQIVIDADVDTNPSLFIKKASAGEKTPVAINTEYKITNNITYLGLDPEVVNYLNTNKAVESPVITVPDTATFGADFLPAPMGMPTTTLANFSFFINGQYVEPSAIVSFTNPSPGVCILVINPSQLGFTLAYADEIVAIGKFV